ncbi:MAG: hypothetical protein ACHQK8_04175 [Bacteroidia bacterium]
MKLQTSFLFFILLTALTVNASEPDVKKIPANHQTGFIENKGQIIDQNNLPNPAVKYLFNSNPVHRSFSEGGGLNVQLRKNGFSYDTYRPLSSSPQRGENPTAHGFHANKFPVSEETKPDSIYFHRIDIEFIGANANPQIIAEEPSEYYTNYYTPGTPEEGVLNVRTFHKVIYKNLYKGIDLEFHTPPNLPKGEELARAQGNSPLLRRGAGGVVEYNFIIHPGADASQIRWKYNGAFSTTLKSGKIILQTANGNLEEKIPESFIEEHARQGGTAQKINVNYISFGENEFGFSIPSYNKTSTLIIDPTPNLLWGTYYGGGSNDRGYGIATDASANILVTGLALSSSSIATSGAFQSTWAASLTGFMVKT